MTATSGPGFSLMQENIGFAAIAEIPCVIVNVQRAGPSTGLPTQPAQADVQRLMLTHFYPACDKIDIAAQCRRTYKGPLMLAEDLMTVIVA